MFSSPPGSLGSACSFVASCLAVTAFSAVSGRIGAMLGLRNVGVYVGGVGDHGVPLIVSRTSLLYLCGSTCRLIARARTTLPAVPMKDSPVAVSLPSQIPLKNLGSAFGWFFGAGTMYRIVSPDSQIGAVLLRCHLRK